MRTLSSRLQQVYDLVMQGLSNKEIAAQLYIGENTVRGYVSRGLLDFFGVNSRTELMGRKIRDLETQVAKLQKDVDRERSLNAVRAASPGIHEAPPVTPVS